MASLTDSQRLLSTAARLRTRTGCAECRRRRKKCDERRPQCGGCSRSSSTCTWPSESQSFDRRRYPKSKSPVAALSVATHADQADGHRNDMLILGGYSLPPPVTMPAPFQQSEHQHLYRYFVGEVLPWLLRQSSLSRYTDQTYALRLGFEYPPLMGAFLAIAAMRPKHTTGIQVPMGIQCYLFAINALQKGIASKEFSGTEDWLLATTIFLCVFENSRSDMMPNAGCHVRASGHLLSLRTPRLRNCPQTTIVFERVCVESFLYHAALMSLYDASLDCLCALWGRLHLDDYFSESTSTHAREELSLSTSTQPVLDASYKFFLSLAELTRFSRSSIEGFPRRTLAEWEAIMNDREFPLRDTYIGRLYTEAIRILSAKADPTLSVDEVGDILKSALRRGVQVAAQQNVDQWFAYYHLWPLIVIGSIATQTQDRKIILDKLSGISRQQWVPVALAQSRLKKVWARDQEWERLDEGSVMLKRLETLLNG